MRSGNWAAASVEGRFEWRDVDAPKWPDFDFAGEPVPLELELDAAADRAKLASKMCRLMSLRMTSRCCCWFSSKMKDMAHTLIGGMKGCYGKTKCGEQNNQKRKVKVKEGGQGRWMRCTGK